MYLNFYVLKYSSLSYDRSKYCVQTGIVIARMDHCCVWLNNSVGHGNHRTFIIFLIFNLTATSLYTVMLIR